MARMVSSMGNLDIASLLFSLPDSIFISSVRATTTDLVVRIACRRPCAACTLRPQPSGRVHGSYGRRVADLPCAGRRGISTHSWSRRLGLEKGPDLRDDPRGS